MGIKIPSKEGHVDKYIGTDFDKVKIVHDNIDDVVLVADNIGLVTGAVQAAVDAEAARDVAITNAGLTDADRIAAAASLASTLVAELKAQQWATEAEDVQVETGLYSAMHHAIKAQASAAASNASAIASEASRVASGISETNAALDLLLTNADVVTTNADVVSTNADVVQTGLDVLAVAADLLLTDADTVATAADVVTTNADVVLTNADAVSTGLDLVATNADVITAAASEAKAMKWADEGVGVLVEPGKYSALHWADDARMSALSAATNVTFRGPLDASLGVFPTPTLAPERVDYYRISVQGTLTDANPLQDDVFCRVNDSLYWNEDDDVWYVIGAARTFGDNEEFEMGDSADFTLVHNGTDTVLNNNTGDLIMRNGANRMSVTALGIDTFGVLTSDGNAVFNGTATVNGITTLANTVSSPAPLVLSRNSQVGIQFSVGALTRYVGVDNSGELHYGGNVNHGDNPVVYHAGNDGNLIKSNVRSQVIGAETTADTLLHLRGLNSNAIGLWTDESNNDHGAFYGYDGVNNQAIMKVRQANIDLTVFTAHRSSGVMDFKYRPTLNGVTLVTSNDAVDADTFGGQAVGTFIQTGSTTVNANNYTMLNRNGGTATLLVNQSGAGDIARFGKVSGGDVAVFTVENDGGITSEGASTFNGQTIFEARAYFATHSRHNDSIKALFGNDEDMSIHHSGVDAFITNNVGHAYIQNEANGKDVYFQLRTTDGFSDTPVRILAGATNNTSYVQLRYGDSPKLDTTVNGVTITGGVTASGASTFNGSVTYTANSFHGDGNRSFYGTGNDFSVYHDGSAAYMINSTGNTELINSGTSNNYTSLMQANSLGASHHVVMARSLGTATYAELRYADTSKFVTEGGGVKAIGYSYATGYGRFDAGVYIDGSADANLAISANNDYHQVNNNNNTIKYRLWGSSGSFYSIGMTDAYDYGDVTGHATTFTMSTNDVQGWIFRRSDHATLQAAMSLSGRGKLTVASNVETRGAFINYRDDSTASLISMTGTGTQRYINWGGGHDQMKFTKGANSAGTSTQFFGSVSVDGTLQADGKIYSEQGVYGKGTASNVVTAADEVKIDGYGIMMNRSTAYITNGAVGGILTFGIGGIHNNGPVMKLDTAGLYALDNKFISAGNDKDLIMYHNATDSHISNRKGDLYIRNQADGKHMYFGIDCTDGGTDYPLTLTAGATDGTSYVQLRYGDTTKLRTTSYGAYVEGNVVAAGGNYYAGDSSATSIAIGDANAYHQVKLGNRVDKFRLWGNENSYVIGMTDAYDYGDVTGHATTFTMSTNDVQGWIFRKSDHITGQAAMSLSARGKMKVADTVEAIGFKGTSTATLVPQQGNEIGFTSSSTQLYFNYRQNGGIAINTFHFGNGTNAAGEDSGNIVCGDLTSGGIVDATGFTVNGSPLSVETLTTRVADLEAYPTAPVKVVTGIGPNDLLDDFIESGTGSAGLRYWFQDEKTLRVVGLISHDSTTATQMNLFELPAAIAAIVTATSSFGVAVSNQGGLTYTQVDNGFVRITLPLATVWAIIDHTINLTPV